MASITITPAILTVSKGAGTVIFSINAEQIRLNTLRANASNVDEGTTADCTIVNSTTLEVAYPQNTSGATITWDITVNGVTTTDGSVVNGTAQLIQLATGSSIDTDVDSLQFDYDSNSSKTFTITTDCSNWSIASSSSAFSVSPSSGSGNATVTVTTTGSNMSGSNDITGTLTISSPECSSKTVSVSQKYFPSITQFGGTSTVPASGAVLTYVVHTEYDVVFRSVPSFVTIEDSNGNLITQGQTIPASRLDGTTVKITVAANPTSSTRPSEGFNMGHYLNGTVARYTAPINFTQEAAEEAASILINPNSITLAPTETTATYTVTYTGITGNLTHSITGNVDVTSSTLTPIDSSSSTLTVVTANNTSTRSLNSTITVSGTSSLGATITGTASLTKAGNTNGIIISPVETTVYGSVTTGTFNVSYTGIVLSTVSYSINGDVAFDTVAFNNDKSVITANWAENNGSLTRTGTITVTGKDNNNVSYSSTTTINQYAKPFIDINEESQTIGATTPYVGYFVRMENINNPRITSSGDVTITSSELVTISGGYRLEVYTANNTTSSMQTSIITITGTGNDGQTYSDSTILYKAGTEGQITISPATSNVLKDSGYLFLVLSIPNMDRSKLKVKTSGTMSITSAVINSSYDRVNVVYGANTSGSNKTATITVSGEDIYGNHKSASATIIQSGIGSSITVTPTTLSLGATETTGQYSITVDGVSNLTATFGGEVVITSHSFITITSGSAYRLNVVTANNTTSSPQTSTVTISGTNTLGETVIKRVTLVKNAPSSGGIVITPSAIEWTGRGEKWFDLTLTNMNRSTLKATTSGANIWGWPQAYIQDDYLIVNFAGNATSSDLYGYVTVSGKDNLGNERSATVTVIMHPNPYMTVTPTSKTLGATETTAQWFIKTASITGITASFNGDVSIASHSFEQVEGGYYLIINTNDNTTDTTQTSTITLTGTEVGGGTSTATLTLNKSGVSGKFELAPKTQTVTYEAGSTTFTISATKVDLTQTFNIGYSGIVTGATIANGVLTVTYDANTTQSNRYGAVSVNGVDLSGNTVGDTVDLIQTPSSANIAISPENTTVAGTSGTLTLYVVGNSLSEITEFTHSGTMNVTSCTYTMNTALTSGTITVEYAANASASTKNYTIVMNATTTNNSTVIATATITQEAGGSDDYVFEFDPASQSSKIIGYGSTPLEYTIVSTMGGNPQDYWIDRIVYSGDWPKEIVVQAYGGQTYITVPANPSNVTRTAVITFIQSDSLRTISSVITQYGYVEGGISPIWKEVYFTESSGDFLEYHITLNDNLIYAGKAYKYPDNSEVEWSINDVVSNYLGTGITFSEGLQEIPNYAKSFTIGTSNLASYEETFYNSWAYKDTDYWLSDPIDKRVDPRQWLPVSFLSTTFNTISVGDTDYTASSSNKGYTLMTNLSELAVDCNSSFTVRGGNGTSISYRFDCGDFVLYYANAYNGWDSLLVKGTSKKTDNIEPYNYRQFTKTRNEFSKTKYLNVITPTWSLNTGITVDGEKMYHLLESTSVYLHNLSTNEIIPVVITNANCEYLNYTNNGKRPYYYNITVEESQLKIRK